MIGMQNATPAAIAVFVLELAPAAAFAFASDRVARAVDRLPAPVRLAMPSLLVVPYLVIALSRNILRWDWFVLYAALPVVIAWLLARAAAADPEQRGNWRDAVILLTLGVAVDLRWFDSAWPSGLQALGKILLVDAGLYGFLAIRKLTGTGFDFHLHWSDWKAGLRELMFFAPVVLALGLALGFIHPHTNLPAIGKAALTWAGIFVFVALPEELFFRAWVQNLLERRLGRDSRLDRRIDAVRPVTLQQAIGTLQLALRSAGHDRGYLLWPGVARATTGARVNDYAHLCRLAVVAVVLESAVYGPTTVALRFRPVGDQTISHYRIVEKRRRPGTLLVLFTVQADSRGTASIPIQRANGGEARRGRRPRSRGREVLELGRARRDCGSGGTARRRQLPTAA